jgi:hypothetical protein
MRDSHKRKKSANKGMITCDVYLKTGLLNSSRSTPDKELINVEGISRGGFLYE